MFSSDLIGFTKNPSVEEFNASILAFRIILFDAWESTPAWNPIAIDWRPWLFCPALVPIAIE